MFTEEYKSLCKERHSFPLASLRCLELSSDTNNTRHDVNPERDDVLMDDASVQVVAVAKLESEANIKLACFIYLNAVGGNGSFVIGDISSLFS
mmetsp:Transcript_9354/g.14521  ORF Transcript_9354/g.14521 Transcript_9354/m.14521 type:complete len:93 (+) Transcript_9354:1996-2274(+)